MVREMTSASYEKYVFNLTLIRLDDIQIGPLKKTFLFFFHDFFVTFRNVKESQ